MSATTTQMTLDPSDLNPTDRAILDELSEGRCTPAFIAEARGYTAGNVRNRMTHLASHDHVASLGGGMYELLDDPRADPGAEPSESLEELREERDQLADDLEEARGKINALAEEIETLQDQLAAAPDRGEIEAAIEDFEAACDQGDRNGVDVALDRLREAAGIDNG